MCNLANETYLKLTKVLQSLECEGGRLEVALLADAGSEEVGLSVVERLDERGHVAGVRHGQAKVLVAQNGLPGDRTQWNVSAQIPIRCYLTKLPDRLEIGGQAGALAVTIIAIFESLDVARNLLLVDLFE